jgi:hypothetical protein
VATRRRYAVVLAKVAGHALGFWLCLVISLKESVIFWEGEGWAPTSPKADERDDGRATTVSLGNFQQLPY